MRILLTGANGYIGTRLLAILAEAGHEVIAMVRSKRRIEIPPHLWKSVRVVEGDLLKPDSLKLPEEIDAAYYLVHSMGQQASGFSELEADCARNFTVAIEKTRAKQVVYLSGLSRTEASSEHMTSRHNVETILSEGKVPLTVLRAGIIIGSGSASFEIMRDLVEKLPVMIGPKWVSSKCQPIAIADVLYYLENVLTVDACKGQVFELGGPDVLSYRDMLLRFAKIRKLKRGIITIPLLTPYLSSLWLFFITSTKLTLAKALVSSLKTDAICSEQKIQQLIPHECLSFKESILRAFERIEQNAVVSSWKDAMVGSELQPLLLEYVKVPKFGCLNEIQQMSAPIPRDDVLDHLWRIGGENGWYYMEWAWSIRGWLDRAVGGVGLRRGRTHPTRLRTGDVLDFWRVLVADRDSGHLLLYAEMRVPGEAWLEWKVKEESGQTVITQTATFRPLGLWGRLYWYSLFPFHAFIFSGMCRGILEGK